MRSKKEELEFCYGVNSSDDEGGEEKVEKGRNTKSPTTTTKVSNKKKVQFDWIPPNVSANLVTISKYESPVPQLQVRQGHRYLDRCHDLLPIDFILALSSPRSGSNQGARVQVLAYEDNRVLSFMTIS